ncbi:MAG: hypothetical protein ACXQS5_00465 [Candidatus Methanospirareceae archaeon]
MTCLLNRFHGTMFRIRKLNETEGTDTYRMPPETEWGYACRAGTTTRYAFGDSESKLGDYAWYGGTI